MLRIISLALVLLISTGVLLPFADSSAHGLRQNFIQKRYHHRRHSRAWGRRHRARMARLRMKRREAAIMAHRKAVLTPVMPLQMAKRVPPQVTIPAPELVLATIPGTIQASVPVTVPTTGTTSVSSTALPPALRTVPAPATAPVPNPASRLVSAPVTVSVPAPPLSAVAAPTSRTITAPPLKRLPISASVTVPGPAPKTTLTATPKPTATAVQPTEGAPTTGPQLPAGWNPLAASKTGEVRFRTETAAGVVSGQASLDVVAQSRPNPIYMSAREERRLLAGVAIADLRRIVIDKMIADGGWVINDYFRDVAGQRVFIVSAQTPGDGRSPEKSWNFYFTEVNGRVYRLTTNTPQQFSDRMAAEAETFIASFHAISQPAGK